MSMACPGARSCRWNRSRDQFRVEPSASCKWMWRRRQRWSSRCKNALQQLNELRPGLEYRVVSQSGPCHRPVFTVHVQLSGQTFEGVGSTKQQAKKAAAELALCRGFVQFRDIEPVNHVLRRSRGCDVIGGCGDVTDFSADEPVTFSQPTSVVMTFADFNASSPATSKSAAATTTSVEAENSVKHANEITQRQPAD